MSIDIKHVNSSDGILPGLVKTVNEIVDVLPSLEVYGDNTTTMVSHHAFGTTIKAAQRGNGGGGAGGTTTVSSLVEKPLPYQWDIALSSSLSDYLAQNPSAQLSAMTADEILSYPYSISLRPSDVAYSQVRFNNSSSVRSWRNRHRHPKRPVWSYEHRHFIQLQLQSNTADRLNCDCGHRHIS